MIVSSSNQESSETNPPAIFNQSESPVKAIDDPCNYLNVTEFFDGLQVGIGSVIYTICNLRNLHVIYVN